MQSYLLANRLNLLLIFSTPVGWKLRNTSIAHVSKYARVQSQAPVPDSFHWEGFKEMSAAGQSYRSINTYTQHIT